MDKEIRGTQKRRGDRESPGKILYLISVEFDFRFPALCDKCNVVFQFNKLNFKKFVIAGEILNSSKAFIIQL